MINVFRLEIQSSNKGTTNVQVYDMTGLIIQNLQLNYYSVEVGIDYTSDIYNVIANQGAKYQTLKVIKR